VPTAANIRRVSIGVLTIIAIVAVLLPVCMAMGCNMGSGMAGGSMAGGPMAGFNAECASTMTSLAQAAIAPGSQLTFLLTLVAALGMAFVLFSPPLTMRLVPIVAEEPPPPPEDPRGVRLII